MTPTPQEQRENSAPKARGRPFRPGQSGNPAGRRKGTVSLKAALKRNLTRRDANLIAQKLIALAMRGSVGATKLLLNHLPDRDESDDPVARILNGL